MKYTQRCRNTHSSRVSMRLGQSASRESVMTMGRTLGKQNCDTAPNVERKIERGGAPSAEVVRFTSSYTKSSEGADSPIPVDLDGWLTAAQRETRLNCPGARGSGANQRCIREISLGLLLLLVLIGFAIVSWYGIGLAYDYMSTLPIRNQSNPESFAPNAPGMSSPV
jgi:hypothetical protein